MLRQAQYLLKGHVSQGRCRHDIKPMWFLLSVSHTQADFHDYLVNFQLLSSSAQYFSGCPRLQSNIEQTRPLFKAPTPITMRSFTFGLILLSFLFECTRAFAQVTHITDVPTIPTTNIVPSKTLYNTITDGPECTGCVLEAIKPTQITFPRPVICVTITSATTVAAWIEYTYILSDGCTSYDVCPYTFTQKSITQSLTWEYGSNHL